MCTELQIQLTSKTKKPTTGKYKKQKLKEFLKSKNSVDDKIQIRIDRIENGCHKALLSR